MPLKDLFRWLRAEHEHTHPFATDRFARDSLENLMSIFDTLKTDVDTLVHKLGPLFAAGADAEGALVALESLLPADVKDALVQLHNIAQQIANSTPAEAAPAGTLSADVQVVAEPGA